MALTCLKARPPFNCGTPESGTYPQKPPAKRRYLYGTAMAVRKTTAGAVELAYETFGEHGRPAVLLVMGIGSQMINWHEDFCMALSEDRFVIRFDNRDVGESQWLEGEVDLAARAAGGTSSAVVTPHRTADHPG